MGSNSEQTGVPLDDGEPWSWQDIPELDLAVGSFQLARRMGLGELGTGSVPPTRQQVSGRV